MRSHGWGGDPPRDVDEARRRILDVTRACLRERGTASTSEVAGALGITRQTLYRHFPSTEELLQAAALDAVVDLEGRLVDHVRTTLRGVTVPDAGDVVVEIVASVHETLRDDPALNRLVAPGRIAATLEGLTSPTAIALGREWLARMPVDWAAVGLDDEAMRELVEHLLRTLQSLVVDPGTPERTGEELRGYLQRWLAPALRIRLVRPVG